MFKKVDQQIIKSLKRYTRKQGRVGFQLKQLNQLFRNGPSLSLFFKIIHGNHSLLHVLKIFLLIHRITIEGTQPRSELVDIVTTLDYTPKDDFQKLLSQKFMEPYRLYLQKRALLYSEQLALTKKQQREARVYKMLNMITLATSFSDAIYTFGRYYLDKFTCIIDFNIILGADIQELYQEMIDNVKKPASKAILEQIQSLHEKMYVIYYNCYFHRYLKNYIPKWVITDLIAHRKFDTPQKYSTKQTISMSASSKLRSLSSTKSKNSWSLSSKKQSEDNMGQSCLFLNEKVEEQVENMEEQDNIFQNIAISCVNFSSKKREKEEQVVIISKQQQKKKDQMDLLKSMERVMSNFDNY